MYSISDIRAMLNHSKEKAHRRLLYIALKGNLHSIRLTLAIAEVFWVITLLWPGDTFSRPTYSVMGGIMGEFGWGVVFLGTAICQWGILLIGSYHSRFAQVFAAWNMTLWCFVVTSMYMSVYPPPAAISGEAALALAAGWIFVRAGLNREH